MNIFHIVLLDSIFLMFPIMVFLIYLSTNKNIKTNEKSLYFNLSLVSSLFLTYSLGVKNPEIVPVLILSTIPIVFYLNDELLLSNFTSIIIIILYYNIFNNISFLLITNIITLILSFMQKKLKILKIVYLELLIIINCFIFSIWLYKYNIIFFNNKNIILLIFGYFFIVNIVYLTYEVGKNILKTHISFTELQKEKQIRLSLFKITHEIKNPIAVCKAYLDMMDVKNKHQVEKYIPIIKSETERILTLLQDFLLINKSNLEKDIMDLNMMIEDNIKKLKPLLIENKISLKLNLIPDEIYIEGDYNRLSQVVINIIKNSIEAMMKDKKGIITITSRIRNNKYTIYFIDNGEGIPKEILNKIKEPFFTTKKRGTGLGVALSHEIIEAHNAKIEYESEYGNGTKVTLEFDLYK